MQNILQNIIKKATRSLKQNFSSGDTIEVYVKVVEGEKERVQVFRGTCIKVQGAGTSKSFTVRKMSNGVGVERTFLFTSPSVEKVDVITRGKVRRSKLYYLRDLRGRKARIEFDLVDDGTNDSPETAAAVQTPATETKQS